MKLLDLTCFNCLTLKSLSLTSFRQDMSFLFAVAVVDLEPNCQFSWLSFGILFFKKVFSILFWFLLIYRFFELLLDSIWDLRVVVWEYHRSSKDFSLLSVRKLKKEKKHGRGRHFCWRRFTELRAPESRWSGLASKFWLWHTVAAIPLSRTVCTLWNLNLEIF